MAPHRLIVWFVLLLLLPAGAIVWLGVRLIGQDRALESRQLQERRSNACDRVMAALEQALAATERRLGSLAPDADGVEVAFAAGPASGPTPAVEADPAVYAAAEDLEFRAHDYRGAAAALQGLARSPQAEIRAGALLRLARNQRKAGDVEQALETYSKLARLREVTLTGAPAEALARRARCALLAELHRPGLAEEARAFQADLLTGRWRLDRGTALDYLAQSAAWLPLANKALLPTAEWLWASERPPNGRRCLVFAGLPVTVVWQTRDDRLVALIAGPEYQKRHWFAHLSTPGVRIDLPCGSAPSAGPAAVQRTAAETGLPWTIVASDADPQADLDGFRRRRHVLQAGLAILVAVVAAGGYFILRAVSREFAVARLQSDFVSAVSHEFRTPLTSLRQFTDLLNEDTEPPVEKRRAFYRAQARATERLHRLVESLLDFGRMEAGARPYRIERQSAAELVRGVVDEFEREVSSFAVERSIAAESGAVDADSEALGRALWNLLDNAAKYSGESRTIWVSVARNNGDVAIGVRDRGLGIPPSEQSEIFGKFVRGAASREHGIKGTGIGLAMVRHIVDAHGGRIEVESAPGEGSTFTIHLPGRD
jgi:signal transduction histidine kinase